VSIEGRTPSLLGLRLEADRLVIEPCIPESWPRYTIRYRYRETYYDITISRAPVGVPGIVLDGSSLPDGFVRLVDDRAAHAIEVSLAPAAETGP